MKPFGKLTAIELWTDPYISKQMLKHHLSLDDDIASRKYETIKKTVDFLSENYLKNKKSVLDLGCGPGLYTNLFDTLGYHVTGLDVSSNSIDYAKSINSNVTYKLDNYNDIEPIGVFDLITMIYCDFSVLDYSQRNNLLGNVKSMLSGDGHFAFDIHNMNFFDSFEEGESHQKEVDGFYMTDECNIHIKSKKYDDEKVCLRHIVAEGTRSIEFFNWYQCYSIESIIELLDDNGLEMVNAYSDTIGNKLYSDSNSIFIIARIKQ